MLAAVAVWYTAYPPRVPRAKPELLAVDPARLDFGEAMETNRFSWALPIRNPGTEDVRIDGFASSCNCTATEPATLLVPAGETREVRLALDLTHRSPKDPQGVRPFAVSIVPRVANGGGARSLTWELSGRVRPVVQVDPPVLDMGRQSDALPIPSRMLKVSALAPNTGLDAIVRTGQFKATVRRLPDGYAVDVEPTGPVPAGEVKFEVELALLDMMGERMPSRTVPALGRVVPDLEPSLSDVHFGARKVGETSRESVTLRSLSGRAFDIVNVRVEGDGLMAERQEVPGVWPTFLLTQRIAAKGKQAGKVAFTVRVEGKAVEVAVPVGYVGLGEGGK